MDAKGIVLIKYECPYCDTELSGTSWKICPACDKEVSYPAQTEMPSEDIELISLRKQLDEATKYIKALEEREF